MKYEQIKNLMNDMGNSKLTEVNIEFPDGVKISMKKDLGNTQIVSSRLNVSNEIAKNEIIRENLENKEDAKTESENFKIVKSPMVGTFYSKPSPDANSFVHIGQNVKKGEVLCVIEAMKLINEIESEFDGKVEEILVEDGEKVDFGKPLFKLV